jgi:hypothetical protein
MDERMGRWVRDEAAHLSSELNMNHEHQAAEMLRADARYGPEVVRAVTSKAMQMSSDSNSDHLLLTGARDGGQDILIQHQKQGYAEQPNPILHIAPASQYGPETVMNIPPVDARFAQPPQYAPPQPGQYAEVAPPPPPNNEVACTAGGAAIGGLLGNLLGNRHDRVGTTIVGAVAGGVVGNKACDNSNR